MMHLIRNGSVGQGSPIEHQAEAQMEVAVEEAVEEAQDPQEQQGTQTIEAMAQS